MATHTQIIEFFGLPACGKSTLCNAVIESTISVSTNFCRMNEISSEYRKANIIQKIRCFPYRASLLLLLLIIKSCPSRKNVRIYKSFLSILMIYAFCKHTKKYDYMLIDHGVFQSVVSLFYVSSTSKFNSSVDIVNQLVTTIGIEYPIHCYISVEESIRRMRKRNRVDSGRLDVIGDKKKLETIMIVQSQQFERLSDIRHIQKINMEKTIEHNVSDLFKQIKNEIG